MLGIKLFLSISEYFSTPTTLAANKPPIAVGGMRQPILIIKVMAEVTTMVFLPIKAKTKGTPKTPATPKGIRGPPNNGTNKAMAR